jgi:hypothetical protein
VTFVAAPHLEHQQDGHLSLRVPYIAFFTTFPTSSPWAEAVYLGTKR